MTNPEQQAVPVAQEAMTDALGAVTSILDHLSYNDVVRCRLQVEEATATLRGIVAAIEPARKADRFDLSLPCKSGEGAAFAALDRFITDHEGNDETSDGLDVDRRAREAVLALGSVVSAALAVCHSGDDDCTNGRVVTIDPDAFDVLNVALDKVGEEGDDDRLTGEEAWDVLVNVDDRTSPEEYPDMCLITRDELIGFMDRAALTPDATQTREAETCSAIVRDLIAERRSYNEDSPTWRAFGFCIDIAEKAALKARDAA